MSPIMRIIVVVLIQASITRSENFNYDNNDESLKYSMNRGNDDNRLNNRLETIYSDLLSSPHSPRPPHSPPSIHQTKLKYQSSDLGEPFGRKQFIDYPREDPIDDRPEADGRISLIADEREDENDDDEDEEDDENRHRLDKLSNYLNGLLKGANGWEPPLIIIEEPETFDDTRFDEYSSDDNLRNDFLPAPFKRSRYYRRYPWKRQNSRSRYDYDSSRYLCTPTKEDVLRLLMALHDARQGNKSRTVNFCNRHRPAGAVFTNIRFLGRRRK